MFARPLAVAFVALALVLSPQVAFASSPSLDHAAANSPPVVTVPANDTLQRNAQNDLIVTGTSAPMAYIDVIDETTRQYIEAIEKPLSEKLAALAKGCPDLGKCGVTTRADSSGHWTYLLGPDEYSTRGDWILAEANLGTATSRAWLPSAAPVFLRVGPRPDDSIARPSVFSDLAAFDWQTFTPAHVTVSIGAALVLTLLLGLPTTLLNVALEESYVERARRLKRFTDPLVRLGRRVAARWKTATRRIPKPAAVACWFLLAAVISGFAEPDFGFNLESLRLLLSLFVAFAALNVLGAYVTWWFTRDDDRTPRPTFPARPTNFIILVLTVVVARIIHLEPTLIFGTVLGVDMGVQLVISKKVRVILTGLVYSAAIGIVGWIAYSVLPTTWTGFAAVTVRELLSQLAIAGIATLPVTLLPFRSLQGETLWRWQRIVWGFIYLAGMLLFLLILLPMPFSWGGVSEPLIAWVLLFVIYCVIAVLVWFAVRYAWFSAVEKKYRAWRAKAPLSATHGDH